MAVQTDLGIGWCHYTANVWWGCVKLPNNPLCDNCYAASDDLRYSGRENAHWGPHARRRFIASTFDNVRKWNALAEPGEWPRVFWMSMGDLFERLPDGHPDRTEMTRVRAQALSLMEECDRLHHLVLTKRVSNVPDMVPQTWLKGCWPEHIRLGVSVGTQKDANRDVERLVNLPGPNFLSMEPLMEKVSIAPWLFTTCRACEGAGGGRNFSSVSLDDGAWDCSRCGGTGREPEPQIGWVITGGESGGSARPSHPDWFRHLRDECEEADVPFYFKQWGQWGPTDEHRVIRIGGEDVVGMKRYSRKHDAGRVLDGREWNGFPEVRLAA